MKLKSILLRVLFIFYTYFASWFYAKGPVTINAIDTVFREMPDWFYYTTLVWLILGGIIYLFWVISPIMPDTEKDKK